MATSEPTADTPAEDPLANLAETRKLFEEFEQQGVELMGPLPPQLEEFWTDIALPNGWISRTKVIRPKSATAASGPTGASIPTNDNGKPSRPLIVLFYGGAFSYGSPNQVTRPGREFAAAFNAVVVCPSYKVVEPEERWPVPMTTAWQVLVYLSRHAEADFGASLDAGFVVGGISAGASIAAVAAGISALSSSEASGQKETDWREVGGLRFEMLAKPLTGLFLILPLLLTKEIVPEKYRAHWLSLEENANMPIFNAASVAKAVNGLRPAVRSPWFSPFNSLALIKEQGAIAQVFPRLYVQVGQLDPLRDDGLVLEKLLRDCGVQTRFDILPDDGHMTWCAMPFAPKSSKPTFEEAIMGGMKWMLGKEDA